MLSTLLVGINAKYIHTNLAIRSLKANAGEYESQVEIAEYTINYRREEILSGIYQKRPDIVGFSSYLWNIEYVMSLVCDLKKLLPGITIFLGGPEVSYHPEEVLLQHKEVDLILAGEGEKTFYEYLSYRQGKAGKKALADIPGLVYREGKEIRRTAPREALDMDELVFPYRDLEGLDHRILYYESIRGCPFSCSYCLSSIEKTVRFKSPDKTERELDFFLRHQVPQVKFVDRTFNCRHDYAYRIWSYIGEHDNGVTNFHFEIAGDLLREEDFELFDTFREGLVQFEIGVQSTNPDTIQAIHRTMDLPALRENIARVQKKRNIHQHLDLIAGLPYEDYASFRNSFNHVYAMKPDQLQLGFLKVLDGSSMQEQKEIYGVQSSSLPPYEIFSTKWLSYEEVLQLKQIEEMVEVYYNSFQFPGAMAYLVQFVESPFDLYQAMGDYYKDHGLFARQHSRVSRYEILWDFGLQRIRNEGERETWREILTYDLYRRDYVKNPPAFVRPRTGEQKKKIRMFLDGECERPHYLKGYEGYVSKQLFHMVYMGQYTVDMRQLIQEGTVRKVTPYYVLFDYRNRSLLDHAAKESCLELP